MKKGDIEAKFYFNLKQMDISYISVAHTETLQPMHDLLLTIKPKGDRTEELDFSLDEIHHNIIADDVFDI